MCTQSSINTSDPLLYVVAILGPLYISLNTTEDVFINSRSFFAETYSKLFPLRKKPLAEKPKPLRTYFLLEAVYGGWTKIRDAVMNTFQDCQDVVYCTMTNLLDNYLPHALSIYSVIFKSNNFKQFFNAVVRCWTMLYCFRHRHYK